MDAGAERLVTDSSNPRCFVSLDKLWKGRLG